MSVASYVLSASDLCRSGKLWRDYSYVIVDTATLAGPGLGKAEMAVLATVEGGLGSTALFPWVIDCLCPCPVVVVPIGSFNASHQRRETAAAEGADDDVNRGSYDCFREKRGYGCPYNCS